MLFSWADPGNTERDAGTLLHYRKWSFCPNENPCHHYSDSSSALCISLQLSICLSAQTLHIRVHRCERRASARPFPLRVKVYSPLKQWFVSFGNNIRTSWNESVRDAKLSEPMIISASHRTPPTTPRMVRSERSTGSIDSTEMLTSEPRLYLSLTLTPLNTSISKHLFLLSFFFQDVFGFGD